VKYLFLEKIVLSILGVIRILSKVKKVILLENLKILLWSITKPETLPPSLSVTYDLLLIIKFWGSFRLRILGSFRKLWNWFLGYLYRLSSSWFRSDKKGVIEGCLWGFEGLESSKTRGVFKRAGYGGHPTYFLKTKMVIIRSWWKTS